MMRKLLFAMAVASATISCSTGPRPIDFGTDACEHCRMTLMDPKFGVQAVTDKGKIFIFDDVNCLFMYVKEDLLPESSIRHIVFVDHAGQTGLIPENEAHFLRSDAIRSPMASRVAAFSRAEVRDSLLRAWGGEPMNWTELKTAMQ